MAEERSLLQKIRQKELEMSVDIERVRREADQHIEQAKKEANGLIRRYEEEADRAVVDYRNRELEKIRSEVEHLEAEGVEAAEKMRERGGKNLPRAIEIVTRAIAPD
jgi:vacuolar-type H+-ATPase subunit H